MSIPPPNIWKRFFFFASIGLFCLLLALWPHPPAGSPGASEKTSQQSKEPEHAAAPVEVDHCAAFEQWLAMVQHSPMPLGEDKIQAGVSLAKTRRDAMAALIRTQPEEALARALTPRQRALVPEAIQPLLEREVSGSGFYGVLAICHEEDLSKNRIEREAIIGEERFQAHVFGQRLVRKTEENASLSGIALDGQIALREEEVVIRSADQMPPGEVPEGGYAATFRGETSILENQAALDVFVKKKLTPSELPLAASGPTFDPEQPPTGPTPPTAAYNEYKGSFAHQKGPKTVFVFLIEPSDGPARTNPPSQATLEAQLNSSSQNYYYIVGHAFSNPDYNQPIHIDCARIDPNAKPGKIRHVTVSNFLCYSNGRILITGEAGHPVENVSLRGIQFHMRDIFDPHPAGLTAWGDQFSPSTPEARAARAAVVLQHANGGALSDVVLTGLPNGFETIWSLDCENIESTSVFCRP